MGDAGRQGAVLDEFPEVHDPLPPGLYPGNLLGQGADTSGRIAGQGGVPLHEAPAHIVKALYDLGERLVEIAHETVEGAEAQASLAGKFRSGGLVKTARALDKQAHSPPVTPAVLNTELAVRYRDDGKGLAERVGDTGLDVPGDTVYIVHHRRHIRENEVVLALQYVAGLALPFQNDKVSVVDETLAERPDRADLALDGEASGDFLESVCHIYVWSRVRT